MKRILTLIFIVFWSVAGHAQTAVRTYVPLTPRSPSKHEFPADPAWLQNIADRQEIHKIRKHAWGLFTGITQRLEGGGIQTALFETWYNKCDAFLNLANVLPCSSLAGQRLTPATWMLQKIENDPQIMRAWANLPGVNTAELAKEALSGNQFVPATVLFNKEAMVHIRKHRLWTEDALKSMNNEYDLLGNNTELPLRVAQSPEREVPAFPPTSVVLKAFWIVIVKKAPSMNHIWVWQTEKPPFPRDQRYRPEDDPGMPLAPSGGGWTSRVQVEPTERPCDDLTAKTIPVTCFFYIRLEQAQAEIVNQSVLMNPASYADPGDYLILEGMHVITRELPQWTWSTFWWHNQPNQGSYSDDRPGPDVLHDAWRNYLMDATLSMYTPTESDGKEKICFNPYLEAKVQYGVSSNCINCHSRATYPAQPPIAPWRGLPFKCRFPDPWDKANVNGLRLSFLMSLRDNVTPDSAYELLLKEMKKLIDQLK
jgi:hypothetical protein